MSEKDDSPSDGRLDFIVYFAIVCVAIGIAFIFAKPSNHGGISKKNLCINNLRLIDGAKEAWAQEHQKTNSDIPAWADLKPYFGRSGGEILECPSGGTYTVGRIDQKPTCSIPGHALP